MSDSWNIIGWLLLAGFVGLPILGKLLQIAGRAVLWTTQKDDRINPRKYDRWQSIWGGPVYRVNDVFVGHSPASQRLVVSTDPNNMGGFHESMSSWLKLVHRHKLVRIN